MKKTAVKILSALLMLSMVFSTNVFAANEETSAWDSFLGLFGGTATSTTDVGVEYRGHIQNKGDFPLDGSWIQGPNELGTRGQFLRMEGFWIQLTNIPANLNIKYNVHVQNEGWLEDEDDSTNWPENGEFCGTQAKMQRIEAVKIVLVDDAGNPSIDYDVLYQGHVQDVGDLPAGGSWYENGEQLGTTGSSLRLEALKVKIEQKEGDLTDYNTALGLVEEADYTAASWTAYEAVLADNVVTTADLQSEIDAATAIILDAQLDLVKVLKVESVSAINGKQVTVTFNQEVTALTLAKANFVVTQEGDAAGTDRITDSATATNIATGTQVVNTGLIQISGNTATLTMDTNAIFINGKTVTIKTTGVKQGTETMADVTKTAILSDTTVPTVVSAASTGSKSFRVVFSEPIYDGTVDAYNTNLTYTGSYLVNDGAIAIATVQKDGTNPNAVIVTTSADLTKGTEYTVKLNSTSLATNVQDYANYKLIANSTVKFTHTVSTDLPTVTAVSQNEKVVRLTFDRAVTIPASANIEFRYAFNATGAVKTTAATGVAVVANTNNTQYDVTLPSAMTPGTGTMFITYLAAANTAKTNVITDAYGNVLPSATQVSFTVVQDTTAPTATVAYNSATKLDVTFNKTVTGADNAANYELKDPNGTVVAISGIAAVAPTTDNKYRLTVASMAAGGNYTLSITDGIKDTTVYQTKFVPQTFTVAVADTKAPTVSSVYGDATVANSGILYVYFDETMGTTAVDTTNYRLATAGAQYALPTGTTITQLGSTAKITLPKTISAIETDLGLGAGTLVNLYVGAVKDLAGNTVNPMGNTLITAAAKFTATATKVTVNSASQVSFVVNRQLKTVDATLITKGATPATSASIVNNADGTATVTANFPASTFTTDVVADTIATANDTFTDLNDIKSAAIGATAITIDKAAPVLNTVVTGGAAGHLTSVVVTYSEPLYVASVTDTDYTIDGYTINNVSVTGAAVTLSVATKSGFDSGATPNVTQVGSVEDNVTISATNPTRNVLGAQSVIVATDKVVPVAIASASNANSFKITSATTATVVFSEALDATKFVAANANGFAVAGGTATLTKAELQADGVTVLLTGTNFVAGTTTIAYTAGTLTDTAANALATFVATATV